VIVAAASGENLGVLPKFHCRLHVLVYMDIDGVYDRINGICDIEVDQKVAAGSKIYSYLV
jgi:hypothetical protein